MARNDIPVIDSTSRPYWDGARRGELLIAGCRACSSVHHYPRPLCPRCWSADLTPTPASGKGTIYTYSTIHLNDMAPFRDWVPYVAAIVELAEGPRLMTLIEGVDPGAVSIGMAVTAGFRPVDAADDQSPYLTIFTPDTTDEEHK
ncbi:Zn-ribbon domain-containing OB-fold protein [Mycobacterium paraseoulense]|uniref:DNA-binding protein n=1 Tax=Mycobacterium paraseoulense TaxID=590652 RepID=A0A1X0IFA2_9MYCO|nr:Zn-ribbon domain-containing OB-fold protein [Mycobacterium paraseoulense]MCV7393873.1 Zn-ribbon domain-containing OB-fold protein [Mycobacterium paraseoulense]ORB45403.1 hypothetical protein BST39_04030 [Mycobacterium paraseoulense]BBZ70502.1 hypothetical protein MPRS_15950 [Mycobacterium paraseoulense]